MGKLTEEHPLLSIKSPWTNNPNKIHFATTMTLLRNVDKFLFPGKLTEAQGSQILSLLSQPLLSSPDLQNPILEKGIQIPAIEKEYISEHFLISQKFQQPTPAEGFLTDQTGKFLAIFNVDNHLSLQITSLNDDYEAVWNQLNHLEEQMQKTTPFAFSNRYGYLTSDPKNCGTGFKLHLFLQLPALIHSGHLQEFLDKNRGDQIEVTNFFGNKEDWVGDFVVISNQYSLGVTEENIIFSLKAFANKCIEEEKALRLKIASEKPGLFQDLISRAYALLSHSYQLEVKEAMNDLSLLKLGKDLGWVENVNEETLNSALLQCRKAHLVIQYDSEFTPLELLHKRAEFLHSTFKDMRLKI